MAKTSLNQILLPSHETPTVSLFNSLENDSTISKPLPGSKVTFSALKTYLLFAKLFLENLKYPDMMKLKFAEMGVIFRAFNSFWIC
jgi:hypothetical protein